MKSLDELNPPRWENLGGFFWDSTYREKERFIDIPGMRGCPHHCTFCKASLSTKVLYHSPEYLLGQITRLHHQFRYEDFFIRDAGYFDHHEQCAQLCTGLKSLKDIVWKCNARVDAMNKEKLMLMKESGCSLISYGAESGNDHTLKRVCKGITTKDIIETTALTKSVGIKVAVYFLLGLPSESLREQLQTLRFAKKLDPDIVYISNFQPLDEHYSKTAFKMTPRIIQKLIKMIFALFIFFKRNKIVYFIKMRVDNPYYNEKHRATALSTAQWCKAYR